jgi:NADH-quinone oxidoreductase subunit H
MAPVLAITMALTSISVIPFGSEVSVGGYHTWMQLTDLNVGILFVLAISSMGVYGVALAGWSSNNKYSLLGGLRSSAQMVSYELPLSLAITAPLLLAGTLSLREIVQSQAGFNFGFLPRWSIVNGPFPQIFSFVIFVIAGFAETNRVPFDLPEAENELVAGFHTEYSSLQFAAFFMSEYANMITITSLTTILFLGGWTPLFPVSLKRDGFTFPVVALIFWILAVLFLLPFLQQFLIPFFWFAAKVGTLLFIFMWVRATLPRFRYDQLMGFAWKTLFPAALINLLITGLLVALTAK